MRKILLLSTLIILFTSCTVKEKPEFIKVENIKVETTSTKVVTLKANAVFNNPNDLGGTLNCENITVFIDGIPFGKISSEDFKVPAHKTFIIPLEIVINTGDLLKKTSKRGLGSILNSIIENKLNVQYKGDIFYRALGFSFRYPIDITDHIKLKL